MSLGKRLFNVVRANLGDLDPRRLQDLITGPSSAEPLGDDRLDLDLEEPEPAMSAQHRRWYQDLGIDPDADVDAIRQAYRRQMRQYHPDRFASDPAKLKMATEVARGLTEAYNGLLKLHGG